MRGVHDDKEFFGRILTNNRGRKFKIISYVGYEIYNVRFLSGYECKSARKEVMNGSIKDKFEPRVSGVGYMGDGKYKATINKIRQIPHIIWVNMLRRGHNKNYKATKPTYKDCYVNKEWYNYQNFAKWFYEESNYKDGYELDKDLIEFGNMEYSKDKCIFIPRELNLIFKGKTSNNGFPLGVCKSGLWYWCALKNYSLKSKNLSDVINHFRNSKNIIIENAKNKYPEFKTLIDKNFEYYFNKYYVEV